MTTPAITESDIAEALDQGQNSFMTTHMFWDCNCPHSAGYIRPASMLMCEDCGEFRDESPDSRINEIRSAGIHLPWADEPYLSTLEFHRGPSMQEKAHVL